MILQTKLNGHHYRFKDIKDVFAKANEEKSGDMLAGIAAATAEERVAAKQVVANLSLEDIRNNPVIPYDDDEVTRVIEAGVNEFAYRKIKSWTVAELKEWIMSDESAGEQIAWLSNGLTSEMVAAVAKLSSNLDLMYGARKIQRIKHCNTTVGLPGTLGIRLQPNHPVDDVQGVLASLMEGLSYGCGDTVIGLNPCIDDAENIGRLLTTLHEFIEKWNIPAQHCVLGHITSQMKAIEQGIPVGLTFQSLAGSQKGCETFGISVALLDEASEMTKKYSVGRGPNYMYFETGQGSELSAEAHSGVDQVTLEARCYGLAKRYDPFLVNTVVGFIGPEYLYDSRQIIRAGLEDHFMGKLSGLSMGCDCCYTNHMQASQDDVENMQVLLASAGCNFLIAVPMGDDVMLNYQSSSYHDAAAVRQLLRLRPAPEFERWLEKMDLMEEGRLTDRAGDLSVFLAK